MSKVKTNRSVGGLVLGLVLTLAVSGCAVPKVSLPFMGGDEHVRADKPEKETRGERKKRIKEERLARRRAKRSGGQVEEQAIVDPFAEPAYRSEPEPYDARSRSTSATRAPSGVSPYSDDSRAAASNTQMADSSRDQKLLGGSQRRRSDEPMSAEQIGQMATVAKNARRKTRSLRDLQPVLRGNDRIYTPRGQAPYPTVLFFHGCSGPTLSHERDWANFYTAQGFAMIAVDSISGREIPWEDVCGMMTLNPAERAADIFATLDYARSLPFVDSERLVMTGFSHGAATVWASMLLASGNTPPIGIRDFPRDGLSGVRAAYMFYGPCLAPWTVDVAAVSFMGESDRYIDPRDCARSARKANVEGTSFDYEIFPGATHTFDHRKPNQANVDAGSVFDRKATELAQARIKEHLSRNVTN